MRVHTLRLLPGVCAALALAACDKAPQPPQPVAPIVPPEIPATISLGDRTVGPYFVHGHRANMDWYPGAPIIIDLWIVPDDGAPEIVQANFWLGYEDPVTSRSPPAAMARAADLASDDEPQDEPQDAVDPNHWRLVYTLPAPLPDSGEWWVEIIDAAGVSTKGWFRDTY